MLSLIVYGRNDSHGYNLHKRAALSLNAMAHVLDAPGDEIIFVDYNTPDELPTFPETIADTLTPRARELIRVIRVRPSFHAQFASKTSLVALESQSRNIAVRRANPANRWILSTNTDMVFVPKDKAASLSDVCGALSDGFYHLPRFELPEGFWERANRADPAGMIEAMRVYGRRYHLNEIVYGGFDNLYEGPGDFQLFLHDDLYRVGGFDERMILGWHVDTNMARRMRILRGKVDTAFPALSGYHCGHTRQATSLHGARRTENSLTTFAREVAEPTWSEDGKWGAPDEAFEELRLTHSQQTLYLNVLDRAVPQEGPEVIETSYTEATFCEQGFDPSHVLPHLGDILFNTKAGQSVFVVASDLDFLAGFTRFVSGAPLAMNVSLCAEGASPGLFSERFGDEVVFLPLERGLAGADIVLLQYPNAESVDPETRADLEWYVQHALDRFIELERGKPVRDRRRIIVVNGTHNLLQNTVNENLDAAAMPYSTRLRHGRVADEISIVHMPAERMPEHAMYAHMGRTRAFSEVDLVALKRSIAGEAGGERLSLEVLGVANNADWTRAELGVGDDELRVASAVARDRVGAGQGFAPALSARVETPSRLCSGVDWESPSWFTNARRYFGEHIYGLNERSRWVWERISLLHELRRRLSSELRPWVLVISEGPDRFAGMLSHQGYKVAYVSAAHLLGQEETDWTPQFRVGSLVLPRSLVPLDKVPVGVKFEAIVAPSAALFARGGDVLRALVGSIAPLVSPGAHFGATSLVHLNEARGGGALALDEFAHALDPDGVLGCLGMRSDAPIDANVPLDTVMKFAGDDKQGDGVPGLSFGYSPDALVSVGQLWGRFPGGAIGNHDVATSPQQIRELRAQRAVEPIPDQYADAVREQILVYPTLFAHVRRNLIPFVLGDHIVSRTPVEIAFESDRAEQRFVVPMAGSRTPLSIDLTIGAEVAASQIDVQLILESNLAVPGVVDRYGEGVRVRFPAHASETALLVVTIKAHYVAIDMIAAWVEPEFAENKV